MGRAYGHGCFVVVASSPVAPLLTLPHYDLSGAQAALKHSVAPCACLSPLPRWHMVALAAFCVAVPLIAPEKHTVEVGPQQQHHVARGHMGAQSARVRHGHTSSTLQFSSGGVTGGLLVLHPRCTCATPFGKYRAKDKRVPCIYCST